MPATQEKTKIQKLTINLNGKQILLDSRRVAYIIEEDILLLNDFHFGFTPNGERDLITSKIILDIIDDYQPKYTVALGDYVVHDKIATFPEFKEDFRKLIQDIQSRTNLYLVRGNIDYQFEKNILEMDLFEEHHQAGFSFLHGHQKPTKDRIENEEPLILGHGHPTLRRNGNLNHCFLTYKNTLLLPTISPWSSMGNDLFIYHNKNFPTDYFYEIDWNVYEIDESEVKSLGKRSTFGTITKAKA